MIVTNSLTGGGAERSMNLVANELSKRGFTVSLIPINSGPSDRIIPECEVFELHRQWKGNLLDTGAAIWRFNSVVKAWNPDVLILNCDLPELFGSLLFGKYNLVVLEHASNPWANRVLFGKIVRMLLESRNTVWIAVSSHLTIWPKKWRPTAILQNPIIPLDSVTPLIPGDQIKRLIVIGRLSAEKKPEIAIELARRTHLDLLIIGDGRMKADLETKCREESIKATFLGRIDDPWIEVQSGDLLIVPSESEGDGLVIIEGLQMGVPMLMSDIQDLRRFKFPNRNYCKDVEEFEKRCTSFQGHLMDLSVPDELAADILQLRTISRVGLSWEEFLRQDWALV